MELHEFVEKEYRRYALYTMQEKDIPSIRDGLQTVQRRILYGMLGLLGMKKDEKAVLCAKVVGTVIGDLHPHGDLSVYASLVNMAMGDHNPYNMFIPEGNFGSHSNHDPGAYRYPEIGLSSLVFDLLFTDMESLDLNWEGNYSETVKEPGFLPAALPLCFILPRGITGIAVSVASRIPPLNMGELIDCILSHLEEKRPIPECMEEYIQGPDFAWGGETYVDEEALYSGKGRCHIYPRISIQRGIVRMTEIPYQEFSRSIALIRSSLEERGISCSIQEDSNFSIVIEGHKDSDAAVVASVARSKLADTSGINLTFNVNNVPRTLGLSEVLSLWLSNLLKTVTKEQLIQKLRNLERYVVPRFSVSFLEKPYEIERERQSGETILLHITKSGVVKTTEPGKTWKPRAFDEILIAKEIHTSDKVKTLSSAGKVESVSVNKILVKASSKNGVHTNDLGIRFLLIMEAGPALVSEKEEKACIFRGKVPKGESLTNVVYPENGYTCFLAITDTKEFILSTKSIAATLRGSLLYHGFVPKRFSLRIVGRTSGKAWSVASGLLRKDAVDRIFSPEPISHIEVIR